MERVHLLIDRLAEQKARNESAAALLITAQMLHQELLLQQQSTAPVTRKIAVVMPAQSVPQQPFAVEEKAPAPPPVEAVKPVNVPAPEAAKKEAPIQEKPAVPEPPKPQPAPVSSYTLRRPSITELLQERGEILEEKKALQETAKPVAPSFNIVEETPTLLQHTPQQDQRIHKEINQIIHGEQKSLNDQLKQQKTEVAHVLEDTPIRDLRKAIGINDKFLFLAELFADDEATYERSIKTINGFNVLPEAEYWINRELKVRLGWNESTPTVQHFYKLVRRRFS